MKQLGVLRGTLVKRSSHAISEFVGVGKENKQCIAAEAIGLRPLRKESS